MRRRWWVSSWAGGMGFAWLVLSRSLGDLPRPARVKVRKIGDLWCVEEYR